MGLRGKEGWVDRPIRLISPSIPKSDDHIIIGTKWVFRNKLDENGVIIRNKARLVAKGYNQEKGINYDETFALATKFEAIRILLAFACTRCLKFFKCM